MFWIADEGDILPVEVDVLDILPVLALSATGFDADFIAVEGVVDGALNGGVALGGDVQRDRTFVIVGISSHVRPGAIGVVLAVGIARIHAGRAAMKVEVAVVGIDKAGVEVDVAMTLVAAFD
jgi:hypothetical protein